MPIEKDLSKVTFPPIVYKYRNWEDSLHKRFIINREVFMASPNSFEDDLDCKNPVRYDLMNERQLTNWFLYLARQKYPNHSEFDLLKIVKNLKVDHPIYNSEWVEKFNQDTSLEYFERTGILSMTTRDNNSEVWNAYANNGEGFCIGYNSDIMFRYMKGGGYVRYTDQLPIILPEPIMSFDDALEKNVFNKLENWSHEEEYRLIIFNYEPLTLSQRQIKLSKEAFNCIILGNQISENHKNEIIEAVHRYIGEIEIKNR